MEKFITNKPAFFKATLPASTKLAGQLDEERSNLERMNDDLVQASSQAWLDAQRAAERMLAKRAAASAPALASLAPGAATGRWRRRGAVRRPSR